MHTNLKPGRLLLPAIVILGGALALAAAEPETPVPARPAKAREIRDMPTRTVTAMPGQPGQGMQVFQAQGGGPQVQVFGGGAGAGGMGAWGGGAWGGGLDEQQRQLVRESLQPQQTDLQKLEEQMRAAQKELMKAVFAENYEEKVVEEKADAVARLQTKIYLIRSKAYSQVSPTLKQEQRNHMENFGFYMLQNDWALGSPVMNMNPRGGAAGAGPAPNRMRGPGAPTPAPGTPPR